MVYYTFEERPITEKYNNGKKPMEIFLENKYLAKDQMLGYNG